MPVISPEQMERLNQLFGLALLDYRVCDRLVIDRDEHLFNEFGLSLPLRDWLRQVPANTLTEMARQIVVNFDH